MPIYDYICLTCGEEFEEFQSMMDKRFTEKPCKKTGKVEPCERIITGGTVTIFKGSGWNVISKTRGYQGKYKKKIRPAGSPVDAPANKQEADKQFQTWVDSGGLDGIKPTMNIYDRNNPARPQSTEEQLDKKS